ncbi:MAG TPA: glutamine-hydrolyzing carbamoyl-phosphate synthase small subunit [Candidatus Avacidaminococcus intestinavium]|uniref:Carbamoyl phosphate synthase small chain n=1 Tax=Candidatus Avacidaminococcus intestinavium TaxID=2840684 RepID=A0A9D1SL18_9FIRM|nr:glutamine-hydrolyzing carbamoyl-phosphate synthase small subunit [Candidatus Avacidaminococcus intestinavium]
MRKIKGKLVLKDGSVFEGDLYGNRAASGEVVFTTGMSGYQETLTDPSFCEQIVVLTYPLVGNYGCNKMFDQSDKCWYQGLVVGELCDEPSNWRSEESLPAFLNRNDIPVLTGIDTRALTRKIRSHGTLKGVIVPSDLPKAEIDALLCAADVHDQVAKVTTPAIYTMGSGKHHVAVIDLGIKRHILNSLAYFDGRLTVFPASAMAEEILAVQPDGIFLSNGPGDPKDLTFVAENLKKLMGKKPIFGICMGHQVMALANGADTFKLPFGHRGINHPVRDIAEQKIVISSQNHGYVVDEASLKKINVEITSVSLNDGTIEGLKYLDHPTFTVQYHPEASPGPSGHEYLFERFTKMMEEF